MQRSKQGILAMALGTAMALGGLAGAAGPVVEDVLSMLEEGLGSPLVLEWLERQQAAAEPLPAETVIRLKRAGASEALIRALLEGARGEPPPLPGDTGAWVVFSLAYRQVWEVDDDTEKPWDLYVYLDGEILSWVPGSGAFRLEPLEFERVIEPGVHSLRLLQERHLAHRKDGWRHEARVFPEPLTFEVDAGRGWELSVGWIEPRFRLKSRPALSWVLTRDGETVEGERPPGPDAEDWPPLCEELETRLVPDEKPPKWLRRQLDGCVRWAELWPATVQDPDRARVRGEMESKGFRPVPGRLPTNP